MMSPVITGLGLVTPLGATAGDTWAALLEGRRIADHAPLSVQRPAAQVVSEAMRHAGWNEEALRDPQTAVVVGTSKGEIKKFITSRSSSDRPEEDVRSAYFLNLSLDPAIAGPRLTLSAACCSGLHALIHGAMLLQTGECRRALIVAAERSVHPLFLGGFQRLGVLASPAAGCRPFDRDRQGFLMSEAAAAVCLESPADAGGRGLLRVDRFAMGADARHITAGNPDGRLFQRLLRRVSAGGPVDLVHAHGTGTVQNDPLELSAIQAVMGGASAILYSHKGALGHSLGASGLVSVVLNAMAHQQGTVPGNVNTLHPLPTSMDLSHQPMRRPIARSLVMASGFGGPIAVVALRS